MTAGNPDTKDRALLLSPAEGELLVEILGNDLLGLREEIYKTESYELRQTLKRREESLRGIIERLSGPAA